MRTALLPSLVFDPDRTLGLEQARLIILEFPFFLSGFASFPSLMLIGIRLESWEGFHLNTLCPQLAFMLRSFNKKLFSQMSSMCVYMYVCLYVLEVCGLYL